MPIDTNIAHAQEQVQAVLRGQIRAPHVQAFAARFPWVRLYTPVNEIFIAATFSAQIGW